MRTLNLGIPAHVDAGKSSLTERLLHAAGVIDEIGSVDDGSTQTDTLALEQKCAITIKSARSTASDPRSRWTPPKRRRWRCCASSRGRTNNPLNPQGVPAARGAAALTGKEALLTADDPHPDRVRIDTDLVERLVARQFPRWAGLPIEPVELDGWDNTTFRLGEDMSVRLPSAAAYAPQVEKEHRWLPRLAPLLPLPIAVPLAKGAPGEGYPFPWSVYRWLDGEPATVGRIDDLAGFATTLADFLTALYRIDPTCGPPPGRHNFFRGGPLAVYDAETRQAIAALDGRIDAHAAGAAWEAALGATWHGPPVWFHGDVAAGNLLVSDGRLCAVIDFGISGVGDPACDLAIAWTLFRGESRDAFRAALRPDDATWARGRGWALWKALITLSDDPSEARIAQRVIDEVLADHGQAP